MNLFTKRHRAYLLKSCAIAATTLSIFNPSSSEAVTCLLGDIGKITCTSYDFGLPFNIIAPASPALTAIGTHLDASAITYARGISAGVRNENSGVITSAIALDIQPPVNSGGGTITNSYGIYIGNPTAATNNYSIYSAGGKNYFAGNTDVAGTLRTNTICDLAGANCKDVTAGWATGGSGTGTVTQVNTGTGLTGGPITSTGTIAVDVGTTANKIVKLDSSGALPAVSGANLTEVDAVSIGWPVNMNFGDFALGQVLTLVEGGWANKTLTTSSISGLNTALANKVDISTMPGCGSHLKLAFSYITNTFVCENPLLLAEFFGNKDPGTILAGPASGVGLPSFRQLQASDLPASISSKWQESSGKIYRATGNVGIGTNDPQAKLDVTSGIIVGTGPGARTINVASFFTSSASATAYVHIKTPFRPAIDQNMYHFKVSGFAFDQAKDIDLTFVGYSTASAISSQSNRDPQAIYSPAQYVGSDGYIYLRFKPANIYYVTLTVDSIYVGNGRIVKPGEVTISTSANTTL